MVLLAVSFGFVSADALYAADKSASGDVSYRITFDANGGSYVAPYDNISPGSLIDPPQEPSRSEYEFDGWYAGSDLRNRWVFETDRVNENITLYAKWIPLYRVWVIHGYAETAYARAGERVKIVANRSSWYERFHRWESLSNGVSFSDRYDSTTTFRMPAHEVTVRAVYRRDDYYDDDDWFNWGSGGCDAGIGVSGLLLAVSVILYRKRK